MADIGNREDLLPPPDMIGAGPTVVDSAEIDGPRRAPRRSGFYVSVALFLATNVLLLSGHRVAFIGAALGWWLIVLHPTYLLCTTRMWRKIAGAERVAYCLGAVLLALMVGGLILDVILPHVGVPRPLALRPILIGVDVMNIGLIAWRFKRGTTAGTIRSGLQSLRPWEWRVLVVAACCVPIVIAGANRLNNGGNDLVALVGLSGVAVTFALVVWRREVLRDSVIAAATYLLGLSLLLATSLRGWYVTGHDIQSEYRVFQLTKDKGVWNIGSLRDAYNACLSITILPTEIWQLVRVDDPYIYKVFFQLLFAAVPVLVYLMARRYWSKQVAILGVVYFVGFPTFFTDMPFLNRQEIAFIYVGLAFLAMTKREWPVWHRRIVMAVCAIAIGLSHYSSMYVFIGTLAIGLVAEHAYLVSTRVRRGKRRHWKLSWGDTTRTVTVGLVILAGLAAFLWGDVATHTATGITTTLEEALPTSGGPHSVDSSYALFSGGGLSNQTLLNKYRYDTLKKRNKVDPDSYLPLSKVNQPTKAVSTPSLPPTRVGKLLADVHLPPSTINDIVRGLASRGEQVFILIGLLTLWFVHRRRRQLGTDFYFLALGSVVMVAGVAVLPGLSVSYGVLRALQQSLILVAPILVIGSFAVFKVFGKVWSIRLATILAFVFLISTVGVMPQILGGYQAQLNLNNSGTYYNDYYVHPQEIEALQWLGGQPGTEPAGVQAENIVETYFFYAPNSIDGRQDVTDIYPTLLRKGSWVLLGYATVHTGIAIAGEDGDTVPYKYPVKALSENMNLVFNNGSAEIYK
jgi:uncharacterized membrane protein